MGSKEWQLMFPQVKEVLSVSTMLEPKVDYLDYICWEHQLYHRLSTIQTIILRNCYVKMTNSKMLSP